VAIDREGRECAELRRWEEHTHPGRQALIPGGVPHSAEAGLAEVISLNIWPPRA